MKNKLVKSMTMIIAIAMLVSMVPAAVSAAENIRNAAVVINSDGSLTVTADVTDSTIEEYTLLAVRDNVAYVNDGTLDLSGLPTADADLEAQIEYIDQPALKDGAVSATFKLRERDGSSYGNIINVLLGGTDTDAVGYSLKIRNASPSDLAVSDADLWSGENVVITYTANAAWEATTRTVKVDGTAINSSDVVFEAGSITIKNLAIGEYGVVEIIEADDNWEPVTLGTEGTTLFEVKSRVEAAKAELWNSEDIKVEDVDSNNDSQLDQKKITITNEVTAASGATIAYEVTTEASTGIIDIDTTTESGKTIVTITRSATEEISVDIKATISYGAETDEATRPYTATILGADGYTITENDVTVSANAAAFGEAGSKVVTVKISKDDIDPTEQVVTINGIKMFYTPERSTGANHVFVAIVRANNDNAEAVAAVADIIDEAATSIYYGKPSNPTSDAALTAADVARGLNMFKSGAYDGATFSDEQYLTADVVGVAKIEAPAVARLLAAFKSDGSIDKSGFDILAE